MPVNLEHEVKRAFSLVLFLSTIGDCRGDEFAPKPARSREMGSVSRGFSLQEIPRPDRDWACV